MYYYYYYYYFNIQKFIVEHLVQFENISHEALTIRKQNKIKPS
jgi:hypothetical protein